MNHYVLQSDECVLYSGKGSLDKEHTSIDFMLTNLNLVLIIPKKKLFSKNSVQVETYPINEIKIYNNTPQIKHKEEQITFYFACGEVTILLPSARDARKLVSIAWQLVTGKTKAERGSDKVKAMVGLVDNALGINTMETVKNTLENGIVGTLVGGIGKKSSSKGKSSSTTEVVLKEATGLAKEIVHSRRPNGVSSAETQSPAHPSIAETDPIEQVKKLKELVDMGILTQKEFDAKKKQILEL